MEWGKRGGGICEGQTDAREKEQTERKTENEKKKTPFSS